MTDTNDRLDYPEDPKLQQERDFKNKLMNMAHATLVQNVIDLNKVIENDMKMGADSLRQIDSLTKERDELQRWIAKVPIMRDSVDKIKKLEAENKELRNNFDQDRRVIKSLQSQLNKEVEQIKKLEVDLDEQDTENRKLKEKLYEAKQKIEELEVRSDKVKFNAKLLEALAFYADPNTYFAISLLGDSPCGELMDDFSDTSLGQKPGRLAREVLEWDK